MAVQVRQSPIRRSYDVFVAVSFPDIASVSEQVDELTRFVLTASPKARVARHGVEVGRYAYAGAREDREYERGYLPGSVPLEYWPRVPRGRDVAEVMERSAREIEPSYDDHRRRKLAYAVAYTGLVIGNDPAAQPRAMPALEYFIYEAEPTELLCSLGVSCVGLAGFLQFDVPTVPRRPVGA